jgi:hypothetical protein
MDGYTLDHDPEFIYSLVSKTITPTTDCVLREGSEVFINTFEFSLEDNHIVHQIFLKSKFRYISANLYCDGKFMLDWYQEADDMLALLSMTPRQNEFYTKMIGSKNYEIGDKEVEYNLPLRAGTSSEQTFHAMSKLYKNWKIEYEFSDQVPGTVLHVGFILKEEA